MRRAYGILWKVVVYGKSHKDCLYSIESQGYFGLSFTDDERLMNDVQ